MLIKHQSFEISQRKKSQNRDRSEKLYEAKKCPYLKFILIPGIIGFMLMCILVNVNFASDVKKTRGNENTTAGVVDNSNITANVTEFSENVNASEAEYHSHKSSKNNMESKTKMLVVDDNRLPISPEKYIHQERPKQIQENIESMKVLPTKFVKAFNEDVVVEHSDDTASKSTDLNSISLKLKPVKAADTFEAQEFEQNENQIRIKIDISSKTENRINTYDKPQILNTKFEIHYKELNYKTAATHNIDTIMDASDNRKVGKKVKTSGNPKFPVEDKTVETVTKVGNTYGMHSSIIADNEQVSAKDAKSQITDAKTVHSFSMVFEKQERPFADMPPAEVGNPRSTYFGIPNTLNNIRVAKATGNKRQPEFNQISEQNIHEIEIAITILKNTVSESGNEISQEVGNTIKAREHEDSGPNEQPYKPNVKFRNTSPDIFEIEHNALKTSGLIGNAKNANLQPDTKGESNELNNVHKNQTVETHTYFVPEETLDAQQLLKESGNDVQFAARQVITKNLGVSKLSELFRYDHVNTTDKTLSQGILAELTKTVEKLTQYHITKVTIEAVGNAKPQYRTKTRGQYNKDFLKSNNSQREENVSDANPLTPKLSKVKEVARAVANHFTESDAELCKFFKGTPNYKYINKNAFNTTQIVCSPVPNLPTELKTNKALHSQTKMFNPNQIKHSEKQIHIQNQIPPLKGGNTLQQLTQYSATKNNNAKTDFLQPLEARKWIGGHMRNKNRTHAKNKHLPWEIDTALEAGNTIPDILEQSEQYRRNPRQVESDITLDYVNNAAIGAMKCTSFRDNCTLLCDNGGVSHLGDDLEDLQSMCSNKDLTLEIRNCVFVDGIMKTNFLNGFYSLQEFHIINCTLTSIQDGAFKQRGVKNLKTLKLINNSIELLTATTFDGLTVLKHFEFSQHVVGDKSVGDSFLTPMAATLTNVKILLTHDNNAIVDPSSWLQGPDFVALYIVDLENNNLEGGLKSETFKSLTALGTLSLQNCSLHTINIKPFEVVLDTLYNLYLNNNYIITLDPMFLDQLMDHQVILSARGNKWQCDCEHSAMIDYIKNQHDNEYINVEDFCCENPQEWNHINMVNVSLSCQAVATTIGSSEQSDTTPTQSTKEAEASTTTTTSSATTTSSTSTISTTTVATSPTTYGTTLADTITDVATSPPTESSDTTTPSDTNIESNLENITCRSPDSTDLYTISLKSRTADLTIKSSSSTSVTIVSSIDSASCRITYFVKYTQYSTVQPTSMAEWTIYNLNEKQSYMFCLIHDSDDTVSPFDCWGHFMGNSAASDWLLTSDKGWFISVIAMATLLLCVTAGAAVYFVLRQRPSWVLTPSERVLRVHQSSHKIVLLPKGSSTMRRASSTSDQPFHQTRRPSYLSPTPPCDRYSKAPSSLYASVHKPPMECAPTLPGVVDRHSYSSLCIPSQGVVHLNKVTGQLRWPRYTEENDYGYNTIDHYEEIKF